MNCIILGDKFQKRMKSKGCVGLIKNNNRCIIQNQHKILKQIFDTELKIIYVYGFESKRLNAFITKNEELSDDILLIYNKNYELYNHAHSLFLCRDYLDDDCLIIFGDSILSSKTFTKFDKSIGSQIFINKNARNKLGCVIQNSEIQNISYDLDNYLSEIYFISKKDAQELAKLLSNTDIHNYFIFEILNKMIDNRCVIKPFYVRGQ
jgi:choline kinase